VASESECKNEEFTQRALRTQRTQRRVAEEIGREEKEETTAKI
jgi:hypothetical protein